MPESDFRDAAMMRMQPRRAVQRIVVAVEPFGEEHVPRHLAADRRVQLVHLVLHQRVPGLPHHGHSLRLHDLIGQRLRALHVEDDRLPGPRALQHITRVQNEHVIAPHNVAIAIDDANAIRIAIEADAEIRAARAHGLDEILEILDDRRIGVMVRERAVALAEQSRPLDIEMIEELGGDERADAVAAVDDDLEPARELPGARYNVVDVRDQ